MAGGQRGDPHVHGPATDAQRDAAILRQALLGDVEAGHDLDPRDQCRVQFAAGPHHVTQRAVHPEAHHRIGLEGLDVDVGRVVAGSLGKQRVDHPDDRRVVLGLQQVFHLGQVLHQPRQVDVAAHLIHHRGSGSLLLRVRARDGAAQLVGRLDHRHQPVFQRARQLGQRSGRGVVTHPDLQRIIAQCRHQDLVGTGKTIGHVARGGNRSHSSYRLLCLDQSQSTFTSTWLRSCTGSGVAFCGRTACCRDRTASSSERKLPVVRTCCPGCR